MSTSISRPVKSQYKAIEIRTYRLMCNRQQCLNKALSLVIWLFENVFVVAYCSVLLCFAVFPVCCSVLQCVAMCCSASTTRIWLSK